MSKTSITTEAISVRFKVRICKIDFMVRTVGGNYRNPFGCKERIRSLLYLKFSMNRKYCWLRVKKCGETQVLNNRISVFR